VSCDLQNCPNNKDLCGIHFTGHDSTVNPLWQQVTVNFILYKSYYRIVGEIVLKNFIVARSSADHEELASVIVHGVFEYQV
jgi:acyl-CoA reductase-like NAD-dependent aldehyde dehydrogenase